MVRLKYIKIFESFGRLISATEEQCVQKVKNLGIDEFTEREKEAIMRSLKNIVPFNNKLNAIYDSETDSYLGNDKNLTFSLSINRNKPSNPDWTISINKLNDEWFIITERPLTVKGRLGLYIADGFESLLDYLSTTEIRGYQPYRKEE